MLRRDFLARLVAGATLAGLGIGEDAAAYTRKKKRPLPRPPDKLDRVALSTWSLRNYFRATRASDFDLPGPLLALLDFPEMAVDRYKLHHWEFCSSHFASLEPAYLQEIKYLLVHTGSKVVNILVDIKECGPEGTFSDPDPDERRAAVAAVKPWVDVAHTLGARSVQVGPGKVDPDHLARTADPYKALAAYALAKGVRVMVENQEGFGAEHPQELVKLFKLAGPGRLGALPDFANFADETTREKGLKLLFPYASTMCHVSAPEFEANETDKALNFPEAMAIARKAGFRGIYSIEYEGSGDPYAGIQRTLDELLKYL